MSSVHNNYFECQLYSEQRAKVNKNNENILHTI